MEICIGCGKHIHHSDDDCYYCKICDEPLCEDCVRTTEEPVDNYPLFEWYDYCEEHLPEEADDVIQVN